MSRPGRDLIPADLALLQRISTGCGGCVRPQVWPAVGLQIPWLAGGRFLPEQIEKWAGLAVSAVALIALRGLCSARLPNAPRPIRRKPCHNPDHMNELNADRWRPPRRRKTCICWRCLPDSPAGARSPRVDKVFQQFLIPGAATWPTQMPCNFGTQGINRYSGPRQMGVDRAAMGQQICRDGAGTWATGAA